MFIKRLYITIISAVLTCAAAFGAGATVEVKMDSVVLQMGRMSTLHVSVTQPKGAKGHFPLFSKLTEKGVIPVCGDSVELRMPVKTDTVESGGNIRINLDVPVQAFDSGYYQLPRLAFVTGNDTVESNSVAFKVYPVNATADTPIGDFASVADPADPSFFDFLPDWFVDYWWLFLIALLIAVALILVYRRYRRVGHILPKKPEQTPYEEAIKRLNELKQRKLWEQGEEKEYYTELTDILRRYLWRRFGINAVEMTSRQILESLSGNKEIKDKRVYFRQILDMADFVKFAKVRPLPDDNILAFDNALRFVEETKPVPQPEEGEAGQEGRTPGKDNTTPAGKPAGKSGKGGDR